MICVMLCLSQGVFELLITAQAPHAHGTQDATQS